jgi:hypothetical protein
MSSKRKRSQCGPTRRDGGPTCFTLQELLAVAKTWNELCADPGATIKLGRNPSRMSVWSALLRAYAPVCRADETCWLEDSSLMKALRKKHPAVHHVLTHEAFKPKGTEGRFDWLSDTDIVAVMRQYEKAFAALNFKFLGTWPSDHYHGRPLPLAQIGRKRCAIIFNLDASHQKGSHWVAVFTHWDGDAPATPDRTRCAEVLARAQGSRWSSLDRQALDHCASKMESRSGPRLLTVEYFDSTGKDPNANIKRTLDDIVRAWPDRSRIKINDRVHQRGDSECGVYSMYYVLQRLQGKTFADLHKRRIPDRSMNEYRGDLFRPRVKMFEAQGFDRLRLRRKTPRRTKRGGRGQFISVARPDISARRASWSRV